MASAKQGASDVVCFRAQGVGGTLGEQLCSARYGGLLDGLSLPRLFARLPFAVFLVATLSFLRLTPVFGWLAEQLLRRLKAEDLTKSTNAARRSGRHSETRDARNRLLCPVGLDRDGLPLVPCGQA